MLIHPSLYDRMQNINVDLYHPVMDYVVLYVACQFP